MAHQSDPRQKASGDRLHESETRNLGNISATLPGKDSNGSIWKLSAAISAAEAPGKTPRRQLARRAGASKRNKSRREAMSPPSGAPPPNTSEPTSELRMRAWHEQSGHRNLVVHRKWIVGLARDSPIAESQRRSRAQKSSAWRPGCQMCSSIPARQGKGIARSGQQ